MVDENPLRGRAFRGSGAEERARNMGMWLRASIYDDGVAVRHCREKSISLTKAASTGIDSAGGFLVPDELENEIISLRDLSGVARKNMRQYTIGRDVRLMPRRVTGLTAGFTAENTAASESTASFDGVTFTAKKISGFVRLSSEVYEDETAALGAWIAEELAFIFADQEDAAAFAGDGTSTYYGIRGLTTLAIDGNHNAGKQTAASGHNTFLLLDTTDTANFIGKLPAYAVAGARFFMSHAGFSNTMFRLAQSSGALTASQVNGETEFAYLGLPVSLTPKLPTSLNSLTGTAMMFVGNMRLSSAIATRRGVTIKRSEDRYMDQDQVAILGTERIDIITHSMGDNTNAGPMVSLVAP